MKTMNRIVASLLALGLTASVASAQGRLPRRNGPLAQEGVSPGEVQRLFDAYVVMQAQQELQLSDEQYPKFLARVKALQATRQRSLSERGRLLQQLRTLVESSVADENQVKSVVQSLDELGVNSETEIRTAMQSVDEILTPKQRARFRIFEEQMERRKVDLLMRARQSNRARNAP